MSNNIHTLKSSNQSGLVKPLILKFLFAEREPVEPGTGSINTAFLFVLLSIISPPEN